MKKALVLLLAGLALLALSGCRSVFERDYYYESPYSGDIGTRSDRAAEIRNYSMLKTALTNMITNRTERGEFRFSSYNGNISEDLAAACFEIKSEHPLGAYAVESLSYDTSYVVSYYMANIYISYKRTAEELNSIVYTSSATDFADSVCGAVDAAAPELVIRCFAPGIDEPYILRMVRRYYYDNPVSILTEPQVDVTSYPADGANCIYDIRFLYDLSLDRRETMSKELEEKVREIAGALKETETPKLALETAQALSERCAEGRTDAIYADTAYGALRYGNADSRGMALAYRALCTELGIECTVVEGTFGMMGTESHFWNIIELEAAHYHVDVSAMRDDPFSAFLQSDDALWGRYIWDTADYPVCDGPLSYKEVAGLPDEDEEPEEPNEAPGTEEPGQPQEPTDPDNPEEPEQPQESPGPEEPEQPQESPGPEEPEQPQESPGPEEPEQPQESLGPEEPGPSPTPTQPEESEPPQGSPEPA